MRFFLRHLRAFLLNFARQVRQQKVRPDHPLSCAKRRLRVKLLENNSLTCIYCIRDCQLGLDILSQCLVAQSWKFWFWCNVCIRRQWGGCLPGKSSSVTSHPWVLDRWPFARSSQSSRMCAAWYPFARGWICRGCGQQCWNSRTLDCPVCGAWHSKLWHVQGWVHKASIYNGVLPKKQEN